MIAEIAKMLRGYETMLRDYQKLIEDISCPRGRLYEVNDLIGRLENYPLTVTIEVRGGVAEVTDCPEGIEVEIIDHDNEAAGESSRTEIKEAKNTEE